MPPESIGRSARQFITSVTMIFVSVLVTLPAGEVVARLALDKIDYLAPKLISHRHLQHVIEPGSGGHDAWGFRNSRVPERAEILAIGDSQTYGVSATSKNSWPAQLGRATGSEVYNLGVGGYGPNDYLYLFDKYVGILNPRIVIMAFYFGNDLRTAPVTITDNSPETRVQNPQSISDGLRLRDWLSRNSVLYQVFKTHVSIITNAIRWQEAFDPLDDRYVRVTHHGETLLLEPGVRQSVLDLTKEANTVGLKFTLNVITRIAKDCATLRIECYFLLIPTKGSVYQDIARANLEGEELRKVENLVKSEEQVRSALNEHLKFEKLPAIDPLNAMRAAVKEKALYPSIGGHPNKYGYKVIAETVAARIL